MSAVVGNIDKCPWHEPVWSVQPLSSAFWPVALRISERNQSDRSNGRWIVCKKKNRRERGNACWACCCRIHDFTHLWFGLSDYRKLVRGEDIRCDNFSKLLTRKRGAELNWHHGLLTDADARPQTNHLYLQSDPVQELYVMISGLSLFSPLKWFQ